MFCLNVCSEPGPASWHWAECGLSHLAGGRRDLNWSQHWHSPVLTSPHWAGVLRQREAGAEASPFRQFPVPATESGEEGGSHSWARAGITNGLCHQAWCLRPDAQTVWCVWSLFAAPTSKHYKRDDMELDNVMTDITSYIISCQEICLALLFIHEIIHLLYHPD